MKIAINCMRIYLAAACSLRLATVFGTTRYVDCNLQDYTGHDGSSWDKAFKTIQEGVKAAELDDVVLVQPGRYDEGGESAGADENYLTNRVNITKRITIRSRYGRDSRDSTFIVGRHASSPEDPDGVGMGMDAIRCVRFASNNSALGAVLEGFTLVDGATQYANGDYKAWSAGGGAWFGTRDTSSILVDCVISNCVATRGGGMYYGNAARCRFTGNYANKNSPAVRDGNIYWCIADANWGSSATIYLGGANAVNCTIANVPSQTSIRGNASDTKCIAANCAILQHATSSSGDNGFHVALSNCVIAAGMKYYSGSSGTDTITNDCRIVEMNSYQFVSTATGDFRPLSVGDLPGAGDRSHLAMIPERYRYTDYEGNDVSQAEQIAAGAIQTVVAPPGGGCIRFRNVAFNHTTTPGVIIHKGGTSYRACLANLYSFADYENEPYFVECTMPTTGDYHFFGFGVTHVNTSHVTYHYPLRGTTASYIMAPPADNELNVSPTVTQNTLWTDPSVADGAEMDGTEAKPFNTLQAAANVANAVSNSYWVIYAKKGRYDKGGALYAGITNRFAVTNSKTYIRLYAVDGPAETFIVGAGDDESTHPFKYGDAAVRCVASITGCGSVNGFTLTDGRGTLNNGSESSASLGGEGGAVFCNISSTYMVEDCVITNCAASRGGVSFNASLHRCFVVDCTSWQGALRGGVRASSCVFKNLASSRPVEKNYVVGIADFAYNCTLIGCGDTEANPMIPIGNASPEAGLHNSVVYGFSYVANQANTSFSGCWYDEVASGGAAREGMTHTKIAFADVTADDYALYSASRAATGASMDGLTGNFWEYGVPDDIEGVLFDFTTGYSAGAYVRKVPSASVTAAATEGVAAVSVTPSGEQLVSASSPTVTFTADSAATRNFCGFYLNGELVTTSPSYTFEYSAGAAGARLNLEARYSPYWYVDPAKSDSNGGRDWDDAMKTLAAVMAKALPGDTVIAAPGTYEEGDMAQHTISYNKPTDKIVTVRSRVVLTNGVTLVSRDGPETTVIRGASSSQDLKGYGLGTDALRCAFLYPGAVIEGFTLEGGRAAGGDDYDENNFGAGATGWYNSEGSYPVMRNCIVRDCVAARGGGICHMKAVGCRFYECRCTANSSAAIHARLINCFLDRNLGSGAVVNYWTELRSCTFGANNETSRPIGTSPESRGLQYPQAYNILVLKGGVATGNSTAVAFTNCAFTTGALSNWNSAAGVTTNEGCIFADASAYVTNSAGCPVAGVNPAVDAADPAYLDLSEYPTDIDGNPRAVNGLRLDIGCHEADWKKRYGEDLGPKVAVSAASPAVCETASRSVALSDGTEVELSLANIRKSQTSQRISFRVNGEGVLSMSVDGGEALTFTDTGEVQKYEFSNSAASTSFAFSFAGSGSAELLTGEIDTGFTFTIR